METKKTKQNDEAQPLVTLIGLRMTMQKPRPFETNTNIFTSAHVTLTALLHNFTRETNSCSLAKQSRARRIATFAQPALKGTRRSLHCELVKATVDLDTSMLTFPIYGIPKLVCLYIAVKTHFRSLNRNAY